jgi:hypothetical protein
MLQIRALRDAHEADFFERIQREPPAAFVFFDRAPLLSEEDAFLDFAAHCRTSTAWVQRNYRETAVFGSDRVWLRNDLADAAATDTEQSLSETMESSH